VVKGIKVVKGAGGDAEALTLEVATVCDKKEQLFLEGAPYASAAELF